VIVFVALCFALVVRAGDRNQWLLVAVGYIGCAAATALGVIAMLHKVAPSGGE